MQSPHTKVTTTIAKSAPSTPQDTTLDPSYAMADALESMGLEHARLGDYGTFLVRTQGNNSAGPEQARNFQAALLGSPVAVSPTQAPSKEALSSRFDSEVDLYDIMAPETKPYPMPAPVRVPSGCKVNAKGVILVDPDEDTDTEDEAQMAYDMSSDEEINDGEVPEGNQTYVPRSPSTSPPRRSPPPSPRCSFTSSSPSDPSYEQEKQQADLGEWRRSEEFYDSSRKCAAEHTPPPSDTGGMPPRAHLFIQPPPAMAYDAVQVYRSAEIIYPLTGIWIEVTSGGSLAITAPPGAIPVAVPF